MTDLLVATWDGGGNVPPLLAVCAAAIAAGHDVHALAPESLGPRLARIGVTHTPFGGLADPPARQAAALAAELHRRPAAAVLVDQCLPAVLCAVEAAGVAGVAFVHTRYSDPALGSVMTFACGLDALNGLRVELGLPVLDQPTDLLDHAALVLVTTTEAFDGATRPYPANVALIGPPVPAAAGTWTPLQPTDEVPLVVGNLGTTPMDEAPVVERLLAALAGLPVQALVTVGDHLDPDDFDPAPNTIVRRPVPHAAVLPHARVYVNHGGLSGIGAAMACGVPLVCLPLGRDQPANAARVEAVGLGRVVPPSSPPEVLRAAIVAVLEDDRYAAVAKAEQAVIAARPPAERAVALVERLLA